MVIYDRELKLLGSTGTVKAVKVYPVEQEGKLNFEVYILVKGKQEWSHFLNAHNEPRYFPNLNYLFNFFKENCPQLSEVALCCEAFTEHTS